MTFETVSASPDTDTSLYAAGFESRALKPYFSSFATSAESTSTGKVTPRIVPLESLYVPATSSPALFIDHFFSVADDTASTAYALSISAE